MGVEHRRFRHRIADAEYVIEPLDYVYIGNRRVVDRKARILVKFQAGVWDSEEAQKKNRWTDEQTQRAIDALIDHQDFNKQHNMAGGVMGGLYLDGEGVDAEEQVVPLTALDHCRATIGSGAQAHVCGEPAVADTGYCRPHLDLLLSDDEDEDEPAAPAPQSGRAPRVATPKPEPAKKRAPRPAIPPKRKREAVKV